MFQLQVYTPNDKQLVMTLDSELKSYLEIVRETIKLHSPITIKTIIFDMEKWKD